MRLKLFALVWFLALGMSPIVLAADEKCCVPPAQTPAACCEKAVMAGQAHHAMACCKDENTCEMPCCMDGACEMPCCKDGASEMACCKNDAPSVSAIEVFLAIDSTVDLPTVAEAPTRQTAVVWFHRPVWVGRNVLQGKYVIEHDTGRMARGEPCTYIYAADNLTKPVVTFHCTHIEAETAATNTVMLATLPDGMRKLLQFQFAGESAAHGYPTGR